MKIKEKLIFKTMFGSYLYGTNNENSDKDYKGVFLPDKEDLLLGKVPKHYVFHTSDDGKRNTKDDIDETYYSLHYFLELLSNGETNALDLFFANTNKESIVYESEIWKELTNNADKLITKNINKYLGFCRSQAIKYSIKGDKLDAYSKFKDFIINLVNKNTKDENGKWIDLGTALKLYFTYSLSISFDYEKKGKIIGKRSKILNNIFGDHSYILEMNNKEKYLMVSDMLFNFNDTILTCLDKVKKIINSYGKRSEISKQEKGADYKALSHAIRVLFQTEELLNTEKIIFPLDEVKRNFVKDIKYNKSKMNYQEIVDYIDEKIKYINENLLPKTKLRNSADGNFIKEFILKQYK